MTASDHSTTPKEPGTLQGIVLLLQCTLAVMGTAILAPTIPKLISAFPSVPSVQFWAPFAITVPSLCVAIVAPVAGLLADRFGRRRLLIVGTGGYGLLGVMPFFLRTLPQIFASRVALGIFEAIIMTVSTTLLGDYFKGAARDKWLGYQTAVASISAVGLLTLGGIVGDYGWRPPFLLYLITLPLMCCVTAFIWEPQRPSPTQKTVEVGWRGFPWSGMIGICGLTLIAGMLFYVVQIQMGVALLEMGVFSSSRVGILTAGASVGIPFGTFIFQRISKVHVSVLLIAGFGLSGVGFIGMSHSPSLMIFMVYVVINQIGSGIMLPTMLTWAMRQLSYHQRGRGTGIWQSVFALGPPLGPGLMTAFALAHGGHFVPTFQWLGWIAIVIAIGALCAASLQRFAIEQ